MGQEGSNEDYEDWSDEELQQEELKRNKSSPAKKITTFLKNKTLKQASKSGKNKFFSPFKK